MKERVAGCSYREIARRLDWAGMPCRGKPGHTLERLVLQHVQRLDPASEHFPAAWVALTPQQQIESLQRLVARVDDDAVHNKIAITFHSEETNS
jgi:hypothetical protein